MVAAAALRAIGRGLRRGAVRLVFGEGVVAADRNLQLLVEELLRKGGIGVEVVARLAAQVCAAAVVSFAQRNGGRFPERDVHVEVLVEGELLGGDLLLGQPVVAVTAPPVQCEGELLRGGVVDRKPCAGRALAHVVAVRRVRDALIVDARPARNAVVRQVARQGEGAAPFGGEIVVFERQRMCRRCFQIGVALRGIVRVAVVEVGRQHRDRGTAQPFGIREREVMPVARFVGEAEVGDEVQQAVAVIVDSLPAVVGVGMVPRALHAHAGTRRYLREFQPVAEIEREDLLPLPQVVVLGHVRRIEPDGIDPRDLVLVAFVDPVDIFAAGFDVVVFRERVVVVELEGVREAPARMALVELRRGVVQHAVVGDEIVTLVGVDLDHVRNSERMFGLAETPLVVGADLKSRVGVVVVVVRVVGDGRRFGGVGHADPGVGTVLPCACPKRSFEGDEVERIGLVAQVQRDVFVVALAVAGRFGGVVALLFGGEILAPAFRCVGAVPAVHLKEERLDRSGELALLDGERGCKNIRTTNYHTLPSFRNISILSRLLVT